MNGVSGLMVGFAVGAALGSAYNSAKERNERRMRDERVKQALAIIRHGVRSGYGVRDFNDLGGEGR